MTEPISIEPPIADAPPADLAPQQYSRLWMIAMFVWVAVWALGLFVVLNYKFERSLDWNAGMYSNGARNLLHEGFGKLKGGVYMLPGDFSLEARDFYAGHPPLLSWMLAGWMAIFGESVEAIRAMPLATSALNLILIYFLVARVFHAPAGFAATVICSLLPMTAYHAQGINMEWFTTTAMLGASVSYLRWAKCGCKFALAMLFVCIVLGCWMDWPVFIFSGLLAAAHWLGQKEPRPWAVSISLVVVPVLMFVAFAAYAHLNGSGVGELVNHAKVRTGVEASGAVAAEGKAAESESPYKTMFDRVTMRGGRDRMESWFINYFTYPALLLAFIGAVAWKWWSRRLARDENGRRLMFRILAVFILTQVIYTLAFAEGALRHDYWNYYLIVPVAILAGGLLVALTVTGESTRPFRAGLLDRAGWALAAMIPLFAYSPLMGMMHGSPIDWQRVKYADPLKKHTTHKDAIFTDRRIGYALAWYSDRAVFFNKNFLSIEGLTETKLPNGKTWIEQFNEPGHRLLYLWEDARSEEKSPVLQAESEKLFKDLRARYGEPYQADNLRFFVLIGEPNADWARKDSPTSAPAIIEPATTQPATAPVLSPLPPGEG